MRNVIQPLISIVIPSYNYARFLGTCIDGVLAQTYTNWELIVVDNGSTDNTGEVIAQYNDPRIRSFRIEENTGPVKAWALGYSVCRGDYFALLPGDDLFLPTKLERQVNFLQSHPEIDVVGTYIREINDDGHTPAEPHWIINYINQPIDFSDLKNWRWKHYLCIPSALYSKELCDRAQAIPSDGLNNICDWDFHVRLLGAGARMAVIPEVLTCYRCHRCNTSKILIDSYSQWIYSHMHTYIPILRNMASDCLHEIKESIKAIYSAPKECYFVDGVPDSRRCANLEAMLDPESSLRRFGTYREFLDYSDRWNPDTENRAALAAFDSSLMDLRSRLLRKKPDDSLTAKQDLFPLEWAFRRLQREREIMEKSLSWRLTKPLRDLHGLGINFMEKLAAWRSRFSQRP